MNKITLENFRCFREKQEARLAPLTFLVGENSTGKTSFLALVRALWDVAFWNVIPDFKKEPYDLGTFDEIAHYRGGRGGRADRFVVGFDTASSNSNSLMRQTVTFEKDGAAPVPVKITVKNSDILMEHYIADDYLRFQFSASPDVWEWKNRIVTSFQQHIPSLNHSIWKMLQHYYEGVPRNLLGEPPNNKKKPGKEMTGENWRQMEGFHSLLRKPLIMPGCFASAPVRSKPRRTYDPARPTSDPEGMGVPMYLAEIHFHGGKEWDVLKNALDKFGKDAGLFDEITVKRFAPSISSPFQLQVKKYGDKAKGPWRNLIDVGYGVSQVLPIITELFRPDEPKMFLMQQPEVHLHPSAQAALGSLFCELAGAERQLIVETHSDYLLDRVRMEVRDGKSKLKPEDVSILFFERGDLDVRIYSLDLDQEGQVVNPPPGYRKFFMEEMNRRLKI